MLYNVYKSHIINMSFMTYLLYDSEAVSPHLPSTPFPAPLPGYKGPGAKGKFFLFLADGILANGPNQGTWLKGAWHIHQRPAAWQRENGWNIPAAWWPGIMGLGLLPIYRYSWQRYHLCNITIPWNRATF